MSNPNTENDSGDDSAPESISFNAGKQQTNENATKIKEQINLIRESQKKKRIQRQEKYIEQKKKKFENLELDNDILDAVSTESTKKSESKKLKSKEADLSKNKKKINFEEENDLEKSALSDFIPLKTYTNYGISVVNLESTNKKPLIPSDKAKSFKSMMYNRPGIRRQTAQEKLSMNLKKKLIK